MTDGWNLVQVMLAYRRADLEVDRHGTTRGCVPRIETSPRELKKHSCAQAAAAKCLQDGYYQSA